MCVSTCERHACSGVLMLTSACKHTKVFIPSSSIVLRMRSVSTAVAGAITSVGYLQAKLYCIHSHVMPTKPSSSCGALPCPRHWTHALLHLSVPPPHKPVTHHRPSWLDMLLLSPCGGRGKGRKHQGWACIWPYVHHLRCSLTHTAT